MAWLKTESKYLVITTELTTRGWIEQMESIGYGVTDAVRDGRLLVFSRYGSMAESTPEVKLEQLLDSEAVELADVVVIDSASSVMPSDLDDTQPLQSHAELASNMLRRDVRSCFVSTQKRWMIN